MNSWDKKFDEAHYIYGTEPNDWLKENIYEKGSLKIALLAEGEGRNAVYLAKLGHEAVTYDYSKVGLDKTIRLAESEDVKIETHLQDLTVTDALPKNFYDIAVNIFGHVLAEGKKNMLENLIDCVKPGGRILFEFYSKRQLEFQTGGPKRSDMLYDLKELEEEFSHYDVEIISLSEKIVERHEGTMHRGRSAVIQGYLKKK